MNDLLFLSHGKFARFFIKIGLFFKKLPFVIWNFIKSLPFLAWKGIKKLGSIFSVVYNIFRYGNWKSRLSFVIFGFANLWNKQWLRGVAFLLVEIAFILYMTLFGAGYLGKFGTLGTMSPTEDPDTGFVIIGDDSFNILLYSIISLVVILFVFIIWMAQLHQAWNIQHMKQINRHLASARADIGSLGNQYYHTTLLSIPFLLLICFTVVPLIFMIMVAFTNFDNAHQPPNELFTWVGFNNFHTMLVGGGLGGYDETFSYTFWKVLGWTLLWAVLATVTNFFFGVILAMIINKKSIKLKKVWRTFLVISIAVPQVVSLLIMAKLFHENFGVITELFETITGERIRFLADPLISKVVIVVVNMWVGIPYTVLSTTGILMNIPEDLYEAAKIDGANPYHMYINITLPYIFFVLGPSLISTFVGNINNFNIIYLLTGGGPNLDSNMQSAAGETDLLITWLYDLTVTEQNYSMASVIGILVFIVCAILSLITYSQIGSTKNEEDFQ